MSDARDVEKNWHDPPTTRKAIAYGVAVLAAAGIAFALFALIDRGSVVLAATVPAIILIGGIGAMVKAYLTWRQGGLWVVWQGAGWFLLTFFLICLSVPWSVALLPD
jgi:hypothetical protein